MLEPGTRLGPYEILSLLGAGGMGEVYRARDTRLGRDVAVKTLPEALAHDEQRMARFQREAQVLASLNHPNIATIHGLEESGTTHALVMELVNGPTLADRIAQGPVPIDEALPIAKQIAEALEYAHERGVIHRDLKPSNVMFDAHGHAFLSDFGIAKMLEASVALTGSGVIGTPAYMSPEQAVGERAIDRRSDTYSLGVILYEMLAGRHPYEADTP
ncbi:MAG: serine/threonine-protein kinase, partial [Vicinamibacterales bacterium]